MVAYLDLPVGESRGQQLLRRAREIDRNSHQPHAVFALNHAAASMQETFAAIGADETVFEIEIAARANLKLFEQAPHPGSIRRMHARHQPVESGLHLGRKT